MRGPKPKYLSHSFWVLREDLAMWEALKEAIELQMQFGANCGIQRTSEEIAWWSSLVAGT